MHSGRLRVVKFPKMRNDTKTETTAAGPDQSRSLSAESLTRTCDTLCSLAELAGSMSDEPDLDRRVALIKEIAP